MIQNNSSTSSSLDQARILELVQRMELMPQLLRHHIEEEIAALVPVDQPWMEQQRAAFVQNAGLEQTLRAHGWSEVDLDLHLWRPEALRRFADQRFGPGVEEDFLKEGGNADQVIYSMIRLRDPALAREVWIRIGEQETSFAEAAAQFGEGPEAAHLGVIGPLQLSQIHPQQLRDHIRQLQPGELQAPLRLGEWLLLLKLEKIQPACFDQATRARLLQNQLNRFVQDRADRFQRSEPLDQLEYHPAS